MQIMAKQVHDLQAGFPVVAKEFEQFLTLHHGNFAVIEHLGAYFITATGHRGTKAKNFTGSGYAQGQTLARLRADEQFGPALTQHKNPARALALMEQCAAARVQGDGLQRIERFQRVGRQIAEEPVGAKDAIKAARL